MNSTMHKLAATAAVAIVVVTGLTGCGSSEPAAPAGSTTTAATSTAAPSESPIRKAGNTCGLKGGSIAQDGRSLLANDYTVGLCIARQLGAPAPVLNAIMESAPNAGEQSWNTPAGAASARWSMAGDYRFFAFAEPGAKLPEIEDARKKIYADAWENSQTAAPSTPNAQAAKTAAPKTSLSTTKTTNAAAPSTEMENALRAAESYLDYSAFSKSGLKKQLAHEKYSAVAADYAVNTVKTNWNEQAVRSGKSYLEYTSFSKSGLQQQLKHEGFTTSQAKYAVGKLF